MAGSFKRYLLELQYVKAWTLGLQHYYGIPEELEQVHGARLARCWTRQVFGRCACAVPFNNLCAYAESWVDTLSSSAPEYLEGVCNNQGGVTLVEQNAINSQRLHLQHSTLAPCRHLYKHRVGSVVYPLFIALRQQVERLFYAFGSCARMVEGAGHADEYDAAVKPNLDASNSSTWCLSSMRAWLLYQRGRASVRSRPNILKEISAVRRVLIKIQSMLVQIERAVTVFIYLEWRALCRHRIQTIVRHVLRQCVSANSQCRSLNMTIPDGVVLEVAAMLVGDAPITHKDYDELC